MLSYKVIMWKSDGVEGGTFYEKTNYLNIHKIRRMAKQKDRWNSKLITICAKELSHQDFEGVSLNNHH